MAVTDLELLELLLLLLGAHLEVGTQTRGLLLGQHHCDGLVVLSGAVGVGDQRAHGGADLALAFQRDPFGFGFLLRQCGLRLELLPLRLSLRQPRAELHPLRERLERRLNALEGVVDGCNHVSLRERGRNRP